jgi:hypothetical protein
MEWSWIFGLFIFIFFIYKLIESTAKKAALKIGKAINVKPKLIEDMIMKMGGERGQLFINSVNSHNAISDGVYTFFIYQILLNSHPQNVKWWQDKLSEFHYTIDLDFEKVETAFLFFRDIDFGVDVDVDVDVGQIQSFLSNYKDEFC